jgi:hypothetical protein
MSDERWEYCDLEKSLALKGLKSSIEEDSYDEGDRFSQYEPPSPREYISVYGNTSNRF